MQAAIVLPREQPFRIHAGVVDERRHEIDEKNGIDDGFATARELTQILRWQPKLACRLFETVPRSLSKHRSDSFRDGLDKGFVSVPVQHGWTMFVAASTPRAITAGTSVPESSVIEITGLFPRDEGNV